MTSTPSNVLKFQRPRRKTAPGKYGPENAAVSSGNPSASHADYTKRPATNPIQGRIEAKPTHEAPAKAAFQTGLKSGLRDGVTAISKTFSSPLSQRVDRPKTKPGIPVTGLRVTWQQHPHAIKTRRIKLALGMGKTIARRMLNIALLLLLLIGTGTVWDATVGDGALPPFNNLKQLAPEQAKLAQLNSTGNLSPEEAQRSYWTSLSASRNLLLSLSPQIAFWLLELYRKGHIVPQTPNDIHQTYHVSTETPLLAAYRYTEDKLYLGEAFWQLSDGQKVAVISHEYRHSRQNAGKRISYQLAQWVGLGQLNHQTPMENEAMDYERQAQTALGINE